LTNLKDDPRREKPRLHGLHGKPQGGENLILEYSENL
jgi:hypothetical protein